MVYCIFHENRFETNSCTIKQTFLYQTSLVIYKGKDRGVMYLYNNVQQCFNKMMYGSYVLIINVLSLTKPQEKSEMLHFQIHFFEYASVKKWKYERNWRKTC